MFLLSQIYCDMPMVNRLTVYVLAAVKHVRQTISQRTRAALTEVRAQGKHLGNPNGARALRAAGPGQAGWTAGDRAAASKFSHDVLPVIEDIRAGGFTRRHRGRTRC